MLLFYMDDFLMGLQVMTTGESGLLDEDNELMTSLKGRAVQEPRTSLGLLITGRLLIKLTNM